MEEAKFSIFDYIEEFYVQDSGWDSILERQVCDDYFREKIWSGVDEKRQIEMWDHIICFILYCGYADLLPGDVTVDDGIQCVAWCARNVAEFETDNNYILDFVNVIVDFMEFLTQNKVITKNTAMADVKKKFLQEDTPILDRYGYFEEKFSRYNEEGIPDLDSHLFIDLSKYMFMATDMLEGDFVKKEYPVDFERAKMIYKNFFPDGMSINFDEGENAHDFADYFCFDYKLLATGKPLIEDLAKQIDNDISSKYPKAFRVLLKELAKAKLTLFVIRKDLGGGTYSVIDIARNTSHILVLPLEPSDEIKNMVFCGHVFCDNSMVVNFLRGSVLDEDQVQELKTMLKKFKSYYAVRFGGKCDWNKFVQNNQLLVRVLPVVISAKFNYNKNIVSEISDYHPAKLAKGDFVKPILKKIFPSNMFGPNDFRLALQIWADLQALDCPQGEEREEDPMLLAIAVSRIYINLCGVYGYKDPQPEDEEMWEMQKDVIHLMNDMTRLLKIKKYDPRYVSEGGIFLLFMER